MKEEEIVGWTLEEETAFEELMREGDLPRMKAIQLYRRMKGDLEKCLRYLREAA